MTEQEIRKRLEKILDRADLDRDDPLTRKKSAKHKDELVVLLDHVSILVASLRHDKESLRRELRDLKKLLEEDNGFAGMW